MLYQNVVFSYALPTQGILHTEFGSIWTTPRPDEIDPFLKFNNRNIRKFTYAKLNFFLGILFHKILFSYALPTQWILHAEFGFI